MVKEEIILVPLTKKDLKEILEENKYYDPSDGYYDGYEEALVMVREMIKGKDCLEGKEGLSQEEIRTIWNWMPDYLAQQHNKNYQAVIQKLEKYLGAER